MWKNWDTIREKANEIWSSISEGIGNFIDKIKHSFSSVLETSKRVGKGIVNFLTRPINKLIDGINKIQFDTPDWVPLIGGKKFGFNIPKIPEFAMGTQYFSGGLARTDERGGEVKQYPNGTKIFPHDKSLKMAREEGKKEGRPIIININCKGTSADEIINEVVPKLKLALANI
jgi:phage-related protein